MLPNKIKLNPILRHWLRQRRTSLKKRDSRFRADWVSVQIGRGSAWLSQVENGRSKTAKTEDLINLLCFYDNPLNMEYIRLDKERNSESEYVREIRKQPAFELEHDVRQAELIMREADEVNPDGSYKSNNVFYITQLIGTRVHLQNAGKLLNDLISDVLNNSVNEIQSELNSYMDKISDVVIWIKQANDFPDDYFSDEKSMINLGILIKQCIEIYNSQVDQYCLNTWEFTEYTDADIAQITDKLNVNYVIAPRTVKKKTIKRDINSYKLSEKREFVKQFEAVDFMRWKNKITFNMGPSVYGPEEPTPMVFKLSDSRISARDKQGSLTKDKIVSYNDIKEVTNDPKILFVLKQLYENFVLFYSEYKTALADIEYSDEAFNDLEEDYNNLKDDYAELEDKYNNIKLELKKLKNSEKR